MILDTESLYLILHQDSECATGVLIRERFRFLQ